MTIGEVQALMLGLQFGLQLAFGEGNCEIRLPPELTTTELQRTIEDQRARAELN